MNTAHKYKEYAQWAGQGSVSRLDAALYFGVSKSTATYHLERAVAEGLLVRITVDTDGNQIGYGYQSPERQRLPFVEESNDYSQYARESDLSTFLQRNREAIYQDAN